MLLAKIQGGPDSSNNTFFNLFNSPHSSEREPPLPVYMGLMTHTNTRKRTIVDELYNLGLSISYDRVLDISTEMGNKV